MVRGNDDEGKHEKPLERRKDGAKEHPRG